MSGLTADGARLSLGGASVLVSEFVERALVGCDEDHAAALARGAGLATPKLWAMLLNADPALAAIGGVDPKDRGWRILDAARRLAEPRRTHDALVAAALLGAECAAATLAKSRGGVDADHRARLRADLARPIAAEPCMRERGADEARRSAESACNLPKKTAKERRERDAWIAERVAAGTGILPAVRLSGGPFGRGATVLAPVGSSRLEWAAAAWRLASAAYAPSREPAAPRVTPAADEMHVPMVVLLDGRPVATSLQGDGEWAANAVERAERGELPGVTDDEVAAFMARAAAAKRLPREVEYLEEIAGDDFFDGVPSEWEDATRALARVFVNNGHDPRLVEVRRDATDRQKGLGRFATETDRRSAWAVAVSWVARREAEAEADRREAAIVDAWLERPPPACARALRRPAGDPGISNPWLAHVARAAVVAELDALDAQLTRPGSRARTAEVHRRLVGPEVKVAALVAAERDAQAGVAVEPHPSRKAALAAALAAQDRLGPGECAVAAHDEHAGWRVARGTLPTLLRAGLCDIDLRDGAPYGEWCPHPELRTDLLVPEATAWAVARWAEAECDGEPPGLSEAVRAVREAAR